MRTLRRAATAALTATGLVAAALLAANPATADDREYVLTHGHVDGFEVSFDTASEALLLQIKDDTRIYDSSGVFRDPETVTLAYEDERAITTLPAATGAWEFLGPYGGQDAWMGTQTGGDQTYVPWAGWSTERLFSTLTGTGIEPAAGQPVSLDLQISGPGDVFSFMTDSFGSPINRYVDTHAGGLNTIPVSANAHVHTNWVFTAEGDYTFTVTPSLDTVDHGTIAGAPAEYHFRVGEAGTGGENPVTTLTVQGMEDSYAPGDTVSLSTVQDPDTGLDHFHWYTREDSSAEWSVASGETTGNYEFIAEAGQDGLQVQARLFNADHEVVASSDTVTLTVGEGEDPAPGEATQSIEATLNAADGALVISVDPDNRTVLLPTFELAEDGGSWVTSGELRPVTVTDTRAGAPGWSASGQSGSFAASGGDSFAGSYLGWTPTVLSQEEGQGVTPGKVVLPGFPEGEGLSVPQTLGSVAAGAGTGTAQLGAELDLRIPTSTQPGTYRATVTFTTL